MLELAKSEVAGAGLLNNYEAVHDLMLEAKGDLYRAKVYWKSLFTVRAGSSSSKKLFEYMFDLQELYKWARKRAARWRGIFFP